ncbi:MAG TPA: cobalamin biosynthesis protein, partial [Nonomuraea sp.]|nr:cobalamin biosynthesis protein [Nonomuraea sp.]
MRIWSDKSHPTHDTSRPVGIALGVLLDAVVGDPRTAHPVALFGRAATRLEQALYGDSRPNGVAHVLLCAGTAAGLGVLAERVANPVARTALTAIATWAVLGGTTLAREGAHLAEALEDDDLTRARARLPHLCGRDPARLEAPEIARATVESLAENASDAVVAPLFWGAVAGVPGLLAYRAINTLDAMIGHHSPRYERFGWAA